MARKDTILTFEETVYIADIFVSMGIEKIRLTGGEPLLRKDMSKLVAEISKLKPELKDLALTTNGFIFPNLASDLKAAGIDRVTISLDSLDREKFAKMTGVDALDKVFAAIESAKKCGFEPIKINAAVIRGHNDDEFVEFARFAREYDVQMRFIEFMPLDSGHEWSREMVVPGREIFDTINAVYPLRSKATSRGTETAWKYEFADGGKGGIGIISPVTEMFCGACSRIRLTADGQIRTCLFSTTEHNLRDLVRSGASRHEVVSFIEDVVMKKEPRHYINDAEFVPASRTMSFIGG